MASARGTTGSLVALSALLLGFLAFQVASSGFVVPLDARLEAELEFLPPGVRATFGALASLPGAQEVVAPLIAGAMLGLWAQRRRALAAWVGVAALTGEVATYVLKEVFHRVRPVAEASFAFPSGHATRAALGLGLLAVLALGPWRRRLPAWGAKAVLPAVAALVLLTDVGRVVGGHHWLSDVVAGNALGGLLLGGALLLCPPAWRLPTGPDAAVTPPSSAPSTP